MNAITSQSHSLKTPTRSVIRMKSTFKRSIALWLFGIVARQIASRKLVDPILRGDTAAQAQFGEWLKALKAPVCLNSAPAAPRMVLQRSAEIGPRWIAIYISSDFVNGLDVDMVADAESLSDAFEHDSLDAVIACSVFEHIRRPWLAAAEIGKVLKPGGKVFVQTHFAFPIHAHPHDYWRFTKEALETLFGAENGFRNIRSFYAFPCSIFSAEDIHAVLRPTF